MKFITKEDILTAIDEQALKALTNNDDNILDVVERIALNEVDAYIGAKYDTEAIFSAKGDARNGYIVGLVVDIMVYNIFSRTATNSIPEIKRERYEKAIEYLSQIGNGKLAPNLPVRDNSYTNRSSQILWGTKNKINNGYDW